MKKNFLYTFVILLLTELGCTGPIRAQQSSILSPTIKTLQVQVKGNWLISPIIKLGGSDIIHISFDNLSHIFHRFTYVITHREADWSLSPMQEMDYLQGFNNQPIEDYANSVNTTVEYTHYSLYIPNENINLTVSGNYEVAICDEDDQDKVVAIARFCLLDEKVTISGNMSTNTDIDTNKEHQQLQFSVNYSSLNTHQAGNELKVSVRQNNRDDNQIINLKPSYITADHLVFEHLRPLIFDAGNEYRTFEMVNDRTPGEHVDYIRIYEGYRHAFLLPDKPRTNYTYSQDHNGRDYIRYDQSDSLSNTEADYLYVHFSLPWKDELPAGQIYLQSEFTYGQFSPTFQLTYQPQSHNYENTQLLKLGAYNYQYLYLPPHSTKASSEKIEGNYYETANEYQILVYYHPVSGRFDQLVGNLVLQ